MRRLWFSIVILLIGVGLHYAALIVVDTNIRSFPTVPDLLMDRLPRLDFPSWTEAFFVFIVAAFAFIFFRRQWRQAPQLLATIGVYYACRAIFLFFLPIGSPLGALPPDSRLNIYGFAAHAYFPGGHIGLLFLMSFFLADRWPRRIMAVATVLFGLGTILAKTHYTADVFGGFLLAYAVWAWSQRHLTDWRWIFAARRKGAEIKNSHWLPPSVFYGFVAFLTLKCAFHLLRLSR